MSAELAPPPAELVDSSGSLTRVARQWFLSITQRLQNAAYGKGFVSLTTKSASIGTTTIPLSQVDSGTYRLNWYARVTTAAGVSSSLAVNFGWTDGGVAQSFAGTAVTGNTTTTWTSGSVVVQSDGNTPLTYSTTYASNPASAMVYSLNVVAEQIA